MLPDAETLRRPRLENKPPSPYPRRGGPPVTRMTPLRWLVLIAAFAGMYVATVVTALLFGRPIPQQIHSVVLTAVTGGVLVSVVAQLAARLHAHLHRLGQQFAEALGEAPTQPLRIVGMATVAQAAAPAILPPDNVLAFELGRAAERGKPR